MLVINQHVLQHIDRVDLLSLKVIDWELWGPERQIESSMAHIVSCITQVFMMHSEGKQMGMSHHLPSLKVIN